MAKTDRKADSGLESIIVKTEKMKVDHSMMKAQEINVQPYYLPCNLSNSSNQLIETCAMAVDDSPQDILSDFEKSNKIYPEIHNLENVVEGDQYFSSCGHMNDAGARMFTEVVIERFFETKQQKSR